MIKLILIILILNSTTFFAQERKLTLEECIDLALENNEKLKNSYLEEEISLAL
jgi:hypothetical protein